MSKIKHIVFVIDGTIVHIYSTRAAELIKLAKHGKGDPLVGNYYERFDVARFPGAQNHLHIYDKNGQLFAINWDGSAHDQSHGATIPKRVYDVLKMKYPDLNLPPDRRIAYVFPGALGHWFKTAAEANMTIDELLELREFLSEIEKTSKVSRRKG